MMTQPSTIEQSMFPVAEFNRIVAGRGTFDSWILFLALFLQIISLILIIVGIISGLILS